jgi:Holliday junction DNA helicase RuvA
MISRLSGTVWSCGDDHVVVHVSGIGFQVHTSTSALAQLGDPGRPIELFTYLHVRENDLTLYGFPSEEEVALFKLLLSVSGVGPKVALSVLSTISPETLHQAVAGEEPAVLSRVPGVGPKTAKAIIFHLKDRLLPIAGRPAVSLSEDDAEVIAALTSLGFSLVEAQTALQNLPRDEGLPVEERVGLALRSLAGPRS